MTIIEAERFSGRFGRFERSENFFYNGKTAGAGDTDGPDTSLAGRSDYGRDSFAAEFICLFFFMAVLI